MEIKNLIKKVNEIEIPEEMKNRIINHCYMEMEENYMGKHATKKSFRKPIAIVASLAICLCLVGVTTLAANGKLSGFFKDVIGRDGAVVGTSYEQATDEVKLNVMDAGDELVIELVMMDPNATPYITFEQFGIESYTITDMNGNCIVDDEKTDMMKVIDGKVTVNIPLDKIAKGKYKLVVRALVGSAKADQPLVLSGVWECEFSN